MNIPALSPIEIGLLIAFGVIVVAGIAGMLARLSQLGAFWDEIRCGHRDNS